ncbi:MAG TPA: hypothetical protein VFQ61_22735 [Polyangiaceae bacterium]|nr:hypothetical protein [Polyangiaceae bacterium]
MIRNHSLVALAVILLCSVQALVACGSDSDSDNGGVAGKCLSDEDICQFKEGASTAAEIRNKLGNAQQYIGNEVASYMCQQIAGQQIVHNDLVNFSFDSNGVLEDVIVLRQGSAATPPPSCSR